MQVTHNGWDVVGESGETYMVALTPYPSCTCMDWTIRHHDCKHIKLIQEEWKHEVLLRIEEKRKEKIKEYLTPPDSEFTVLS